MKRECQSKEKTAESISFQNNTVAAMPEWIRLPAPGTACPRTGLKRSKLNELILPSEINGNNPPVKSICLRNKGQKKGVRLIHYASLLAYLETMVEKEVA